MNWPSIDISAPRTDFLIISLNKCVSIDAFKCSLKAELFPQIVSLGGQFINLKLETEHFFNPTAEILV